VEGTNPSRAVRTELHHDDIRTVDIVHDPELRAALILSRRGAGSDHRTGREPVRDLAEGKRDLAGSESLSESGIGSESGMVLSKHAGIIPCGEGKSRGRMQNVDNLWITFDRK
jgi:hypothetical protein